VYLFFAGMARFHNSPFGAHRLFFFIPSKEDSVPLQDEIFTSCYKIDLDLHSNLAAFHH